MKQLEKLRSLPEGQRKLILWGVMIVVGVLLALWWIPQIQERFQTVKEADLREEFSIPALEEQLNTIPNGGG